MVSVGRIGDGRPAALGVVAPGIWGPRIVAGVSAPAPAVVILGTAAVIGVSILSVLGTLPEYTAPVKEGMVAVVLDRLGALLLNLLSVSNNDVVVAGVCTADSTLGVTVTKGFFPLLLRWEVLEDPGSSLGFL